MAIKKLHPKLIALIAAGEVANRPAAIVKELVENSIDAGANQIKVDLVDGGFEKIRVIDNGSGMGQGDLLDSYKKHTTSKISTLKDLENVNTLGFRGEALNSIATVSTLTIRSKTKEANHGYEITVSEGTLLKESLVGMPDGTEVLVTDLFKNVPARKKFQKKPASEVRKTLQIIEDLAIANPIITFQVKNNKQLLVHFGKCKNRIERLKQVLEDEIYTKLIEVRHSKGNLFIEGFISHPQGGKTGKSAQYLSVNGRCIKDSRISSEVKKAYGTLLESDKFPPFALNITLPHQEVDINVDPKKNHAEFLNMAEILSFVFNAIKKTLYENNLSYLADSSDRAKTKMDPFVANTLKEKTVLWNIKTNAQSENEEIMQLHKLYLVVETKEGAALIDQHAAHERILYEGFLEEFKNEHTKTFKLKKGLVLELKAKDMAVLNEHTETLSKLGFEFETFGKNKLKVTSVPQIYKENDIKTLFAEMLEDLEQEGTKKDVYAESLKTISYLACRGAIKSGEYLTQSERKNLINKLADTTSQYTCPHGRPVHLKITLKELEKMFRRV